MGLLDKLKKTSTPAAATPAVAPTTVAASSPSPASGGFINLKKEAGISLRKHNLQGVRAAVYLVLDYSGSMRGYYRDHTVQDFTEKVLAVSVNLDDDGTVPVVLFDSRAREAVEVSVANYGDAVDRMVASAGHMGTTNYAAAMRAVIKLHEASGSQEPALVIFQTDGSPDSRREAEEVLCEASNLPLFWQFVGFGRDDFAFLRKLDELEVPKKRRVDNAGFFPAGPAPRDLATATLYDNLLGEFPEWLKAARAEGILS